MELGAGRSKFFSYGLAIIKYFLNRLALNIQNTMNPFYYAISKISNVYYI